MPRRSRPRPERSAGGPDISREIIIPADLWEGEAEGIISAWLYADGAQVQAGAVVAEVMVEKVSHDLLAPATGRLTILVDEEDPFVRGAVVGRIG